MSRKEGRGQRLSGEIEQSHSHVPLMLKCSSIHARAGKPFRLAEGRGHFAAPPTRSAWVAPPRLQDPALQGRTTGCSGPASYGAWRFSPAVPGGRSAP